jgi:hypothetical protein
MRGNHADWLDEVLLNPCRQDEPPFKVIRMKLYISVCHCSELLSTPQYLRFAYFGPLSQTVHLQDRADGISKQPDTEETLHVEH